MNINDERDIWKATAVAVLTGVTSNKILETDSDIETAANIAIKIADIVTYNCKLRYGEAALIQRGIPRCAECEKETNSESVLQKHGLLFCNQECIDKFENISPLPKYVGEVNE